MSNTTTTVLTAGDDDVDTTVRLRTATPADADSVARIRGVGPITVDPTVQTRGVGRQLMRAVIDCGADGAGVRLLQDAFNTRSMGLYTDLTDLGFVTREPIALVTASRS